MVAPPPAVAAGMPGMPFGTMGGQASGVPCPSMASAPTSSHDRPPPGDPVGVGS